MAFNKKNLFPFLLALGFVIILPILLLKLDSKSNLDLSLQQEIARQEKAWEYANQIVQPIIKEAEEKLGLFYNGPRYTIKEKVDMLGMHFSIARRASIEEARALNLYLVNKLRDAINHHEQIQPYLREVPFENVDISIDFEGPNRVCSKKNVNHVSNITTLSGKQDKLIYRSKDPFRDTSYPPIIEPYDEAVRLNEASPIKNLASHQTTNLEKAIDTTFRPFLLKIWNDYDLDCWDIGGDIDDSFNEVGCHLVAHYPATQNEARKLLLTVVDVLLKNINNNEALKPYLAEDPFPANRLKIRLRFTDKNHYSYLDGTLEYVVLDGNEISYHQQIKIPGKNEDFYGTIESKQIAKESYLEALRLTQLIP